MLDDFRTNVQLNSLYRARLDFERQPFARAKGADEAQEARAEAAAANAAKAAALAEAAEQRTAKGAARAAKERPAARLRALGVDPDAA